MGDRLARAARQHKEYHMNLTEVYSKNVRVAICVTKLYKNLRYFLLSRDSLSSFRFSFPDWRIFSHARRLLSGIQVVVLAL